MASMSTPLSPNDDARQIWKIGDLAKRSGFSVRTLHYYEEIGLLAPSLRTPTGHRVYTRADVERLQRVVSLRQLGFALEDIKGALDNPDFSAERVVTLQMERLTTELEDQRELLERLKGVRRFMEQARHVSTEDLLNVIALTGQVTSSLTPERQQGVRDRRDTLGNTGMRKAEVGWQTLIAAVQAEMKKGTDPADPVMQAHAKTWKSYVDAFTGGDPAVAQAVHAMYERQPKQTTAFGPDPAMRAYVGAAMRAAGIGMP